MSTLIILFVPLNRAHTWLTYFNENIYFSPGPGPIGKDPTDLPTSRKVYAEAPFVQPQNIATDAGDHQMKNETETPNSSPRDSVSQDDCEYF